MQKEKKENKSSPASKRLKLDSDTSGSSQCIQAVETTKPVAILGEEYSRPVQTISVYVADLLNPKLASKCIRQLKETFPLKDLQHLKRIKRLSDQERGEVLQILIKPVSSDELIKNVHYDVMEKLGIKSNDLGQPCIVQVPRHVPLTREQFNNASTLWPTSFFENKYISKLISGEVFNDDAMHNINSYMAQAIIEAKKGKTIGMVGLGVVVVDPSKEQVIATAYDLRRHGDPLQHAVMVAIDIVAQSQSGGTWNLGYKQDNHTWTLHQQQLRNISNHKDGENVDTNQSKKLVDNIGPSQTDKDGPYLCTGYDMYLTREPCVMCAMSLVHSRIRRVFYGCKDAAVGALGSKYSIHVQEGLNHHYEAFCGVLEKQCSEL